MKIIDLEIPYNEAFETEADQYLNKIFNKRKVCRIKKTKKINLITYIVCALINIFFIASGYIKGFYLSPIMSSLVLSLCIWRLYVEFIKK